MSTSGGSFAEIERQRLSRAIPIDRLCALAGVTVRGYWRWKSGAVEPRADALARLSLALQRHKLHFAGEASRIAPHAAYKMALVFAAAELKVDQRMALEADPGRRATQNPDWMAAARARRIAMWIANQMLGFAGADVGRAAGLTKAGVSRAIKDLEWERDQDAQLDSLLNRIEEIFS